MRGHIWYSQRGTINKIKVRGSNRKVYFNIISNDMSCSSEDGAFTLHARISIYFTITAKMPWKESHVTSVCAQLEEQRFMVGYIYSTPNCRYIEFTALMTKPINYCRSSFSNLMFLYWKAEKIDDTVITYTPILLFLMCFFFLSFHLER